MEEKLFDLPIAVWIDDNMADNNGDTFCSFLSRKAMNKFEMVLFGEEDKAIEFILKNRNMIFMVLQDSNRSQSRIISSWKKLRPSKTPLIGSDGVCGDFSTYVVDAYIPESTQIFAGSYYCSEEIKIINEWCKIDSRIFFKSKLSIVPDGVDFCIQQLNRWQNARENVICSEESLLIQPVAEEMAIICGVRPDYLSHLTSRQFEELIAAIFKNHGFQVELTSQTRDGGYDIVAISGSKIRSETLLIEVKHFAPNRPVGVGIVRALYGVKKLHKARKAILVTSSYVSDDAKREFSRVIPWELEVKERSDVIQWCASYVDNILMED